ncbi:hypothetical protein G9A89_008428 [Geosiphon pyriformis]|nr:hypothetical protein G9A89_008428 [Geosiphon pyriformis]
MCGKMLHLQTEIHRKAVTFFTQKFDALVIPSFEVSDILERCYAESELSSKIRLTPPKLVAGMEIFKESVINRDENGIPSYSFSARSSEGFGRNIENSPPKTLVTDPVLVETLGYFAAVANIPYCNFFYENNKKAIMGYFRGLEMTHQQWKKERFNLKQYKTRSGDSYLDDRWAKEFEGRETGNGKDSFLIKRIIQAVVSLANATVTKGQSFDVYLTGHGIGGVYAQIAAVTLVSLGIQEIIKHYLPDRLMKVTLFTFGQPRTGDEKFAKIVNSYKNELTVYRVTNRNDFVPQFPKRDFLSYRRYAHAETEFWISEIDCDCHERPSYSDSFAIYKCPGFLKKKKKFGENQNCNAGTDGSSSSANFGPYIGTTFGDCRTINTRVEPIEYSKL